MHRNGCFAEVVGLSRVAEEENATQLALCLPNTHLEGCEF